MTTAPTAPTARPHTPATAPARAPHAAGTGHLPDITLPPTSRPIPTPVPAARPAIPEPAITTTSSAPAPGATASPTDGPDAEPKAGPRITRGHKALIGLVVLGVFVIAGIGFAGSYSAVTVQAEGKGFGWFSHWITVGVDCGIGVFLGLDLLLTWLRMPYPLLRPGAWFLTAATIVFNASASWPDPIGVGMHATIPLLFVLAVEAARHSISWAADLAVQEHTQTPPLSRWFLAPWPTFRLWRRQHLWEIRRYRDVLDREKEASQYRQMLRAVHGRRWRSKANHADLLALRFTRQGVPLAVAHDRARTELAALAVRSTAVDRTQADRTDRTATAGPDRTADHADRTGSRPQTDRGTGPDRMDRTADHDGPDRLEMDRTATADQADRTGPEADRAQATKPRTAPVRPKRSAQPVQPTTGPDRTADGDLVLNDTEQQAVDFLTKSARSISKRSIAEVVRIELGRSIGSDRAAEIARHYRTLRSA